MFTELMPLLKQRVVMITISDIGEGLVRLNVIPRKLESNSENTAVLTAPLSITGKPEELDRELAGQLLSFTESILKTGSNLEELKTQHAAAVKALEAENKKRLDEKKKANGSKAADKAGTTVVSGQSAGPEFRDGKPVFGTKGVPATSESRSLFEPATAQPQSEVTEGSATDESTAPQPQHPHASTGFTGVVQWVGATTWSLPALRMCIDVELLACWAKERPGGDMNSYVLAST